MKVVDQELKKQLGEFVNDCPSKTKAAELLGISDTYLKKILNGKVDVLKESWTTMEPVLAPFLKPSPSTFPPSPRPPEEHGNATLMDASEFVVMPVVGIAHAAEWDAVIQPFAEFAEANKNEVIGVPRKWANDVGCVRVEGRSMLPYYPEGTIVLFSLVRRPENGKRVIAKLKDDGAVIFKIFYKLDDGSTLLKSINGDLGRDYRFSSAKENPFTWIYRVTQSFRNEDDLDEALEDAGELKDLRAKYGEDAQ